ncbi:hypothetical protein [Kineococcus radiotolerans]|uniref:Uncharacterized protein n=1 Tax=Kineococcus radiotolerans (strain ATCC BAA-149 / DSM 14245 / SRS30216) TaxID=266940 RepID=A6WBY0_KINRD|nr:hypothetical protein [Kineococcus radiotolerans]ABS04319.1 hypothetical protein Krad_2852 [Kineococcus radiotolerans SRS30216 = ATCC BAA-149]
MHAVPSGEERRQLLAAVALPPETATPAQLALLLTDALRNALAPHLHPTVTDWTEYHLRTSDDLAGRRPPARGEYDTDLETALSALERATAGEELLGPTADLRADRLEDVAVSAQRPGRSTDPETFWNDRLQACLDLRGATLSISVPQALLREHDATAPAHALAEWICRAGVEHHVLTGYLTLDEHVSASNTSSAWEIAVGAPWWERDLRRTLWGYGWGVLLRPAHLEVIGGLPALRALLSVLPAGGRVRENRDGSVWLQLSADIRTMTWQDVATTRGLLLPVLPRGEQSVEEYYASAQLPFHGAVPYWL